MTEKIIFKALYPHFETIFQISKVLTNRFVVITKALRSIPREEFDLLILKELKKLGFYKDGEDLRVVKSLFSKIDTWACRKTTIAFGDHSYNQYNTII